MASHTPGPWKVYRKDEKASGVEAQKKDGVYRAVATLADRGWHWPPQQAEGNARLISAGPELLEACKLAYNYLDPVFGVGVSLEEVREKLKEAVVKAQGL